MIAASDAVAPAYGPNALASTVEHIPVTVYATSAQASKAVAQEIAALITLKAARGEKTVLGLATGSTPTSVYDELIRLHREEGLSFKNVITFNLDEYYPIDPSSIQSYHRFMREHLFDHIDIPPGNVNIPSGTIPQHKVAEHCQEYERRIKDAGGLDYQILGIGRTGHVGFNEPGAPFDSRTRVVRLSESTRRVNAGDFESDRAPERAITVGMATIFESREVLLLASGTNKAAAVAAAVEGPLTASCPASVLQLHPHATVVVDEAAAAMLERADYYRYTLQHKLPHQPY